MSTNTISYICEMTEPRIAATSTAVGNDIYLIGGSKINSWSNRNSVRKSERFDTLTSTWTTITESPADYMRDGLCSVAANGNIYVLGGKTLNTMNKLMGVYNINNGTWSSVTGQERNFPSAQYDGGNYIYVYGDSEYGYTAQGDRYNIQNNTWETISSPPSFSEPRYKVGFEIVDGFMYLFGGNKAVMEIFIP